MTEHRRNVCGQDVKARVERELVGEDGVAYHEGTALVDLSETRLHASEAIRGKPVFSENAEHEFREPTTASYPKFALPPGEMHPLRRRPPNLLGR
jgi:hypothetical protein